MDLDHGLAYLEAKVMDVVKCNVNPGQEHLADLGTFVPIAMYVSKGPTKFNESVEKSLEYIFQTYRLSYYYSQTETQLNSLVSCEPMILSTIRS